MALQPRVIAQGMFPAWSPGGKSLSFVRVDERGLQQLWVHQLATGAERQLTRRDHHGRSSWSADGTELVVHAVAEEHVLSRGATLRNISHTWSRKPQGKQSVLDLMDDCPGLHHDAEHSMETFYRCTNQWPGHLFTMGSADGRHRRQITFSWELPYVRGHGAHQNVPAWSRANGWVAYFEGQTLTGPADIVAMLPGDKEHATTTRLTYGAEYGWIADDPDWSPDGQWITFMAYHSFGRASCYVAAAFVGEWPPHEIVDLGMRFTPQIPGHVTFTRQSCNYAPLPSWRPRPASGGHRARLRQSSVSALKWHLPTHTPPPLGQARHHDARGHALAQEAGGGAVRPGHGHGRGRGGAVVG